MISTLDDLHTWGVALGTGEGILTPEMQQLRIDSLTSTIPGNTPERTYGIGMGRTGGWIGHTGEIPGYNTVLQYDPQNADHHRCHRQQRHRRRQGEPSRRRLHRIRRNPRLTSEGPLGVHPRLDALVPVIR